MLPSPCPLRLAFDRSLLMLASIETQTPFGFSDYSDFLQIVIPANRSFPTLSHRDLGRNDLGSVEAHLFDRLGWHLASDKSQQPVHSCSECIGLVVLAVGGEIVASYLELLEVTIRG